MHVSSQWYTLSTISITLSEKNRKNLWLCFIQRKSLIAADSKEFTYLIDTFQLSPQQCEQFIQYAQLLKNASKEFNLTTITDDASIIQYHFIDSLMVSNYIDMKTIKQCADVGTGGGFPGIPLKILYPHLSMVLIEVTEKKIRFLEDVIQQLGLSSVEIVNLDWRTFLRTTSYPIELFVARASLHSDELLKMFKPACVYQQATLVYWASASWNAQPEEKKFIKEERSYRVGTKERRLIFFTNPIGS